jgi:dTDP-L-rhamnose 4-epimerase
VLNKKPPIIFEDGKQTRDFVNVKDIARANLAALKWKGEGQVVLNVGTGRALSVLEVVNAVSRGLNGKEAPTVTGIFRMGDIKDADDAKGRVGAAERIVEKGLNLSLAMKKAALALNGVGGGHNIAAGATIPKGKEEDRS